jgi:hypothetical protein
MEPLLLIITFGVLGAGIKYIDDAYDLGVFRKDTALFMAVLMGLLMGSVSAIDALSATFFLSFIVFALITRKIDNLAFAIGTLLVFVIPVVRSIYQPSDYTINWLILSTLIFSGWVDEEGNLLADKKKIKGMLYQFFRYRIFMKIIVFLLAILHVIPFIYFIAFMAYDLSYISVSFIGHRKLTKANYLKANGLK